MCSFHQFYTLPNLWPQCYDIGKSEPLGQALIINNKTFVPKEMTSRPGSEHDVASLSETLPVKLHLFIWFQDSFCLGFVL